MFEAVFLKVSMFGAGVFMNRLRELVTATMGVEEP